MFSVAEYNRSRAAFEGHEVICFFNVIFVVINGTIFSK